MPDIILRETNAPATITDEHRERVADYLLHSRADNTLRSYASAWRGWLRFCDRFAYCPMPATPESVAAYLTHLADTGRKAATIGLVAAAIRYYHECAGHQSPTEHVGTKRTAEGVRRRIGTAQVAKEPVLADELRAMIAGCDRTTTAGLRDAALLTIGHAGGFRRSELVALNIEDIRDMVGKGLRVTIRRSKTDQEGQGRTLGLPYLPDEYSDVCPTRAYRAWRERLDADAGPVFVSVDRYGHARSHRLSGGDVARLVKHYAEEAGLDPKDYSGHSLRSGHATAAALAGASERDIMRQTGHQTERMVRRYIHEADLFRDNAASSIWR